MPLDGETATQRRERLERERDALLEQEELEKLEEQVSTLRIRRAKRPVEAVDLKGTLGPEQADAGSKR